MTEALRRTLGTRDAAVLGLGAMLGAGAFVALGPATRAAGSGVWLSLVLAGVVAWLNATSAVRLAVEDPTSGGVYAWGRARLNAGVGTTAGAAFLLGKALSSGAAAGAVAAYLVPAQGRLVAALVVVVLTVAACAGARRGARMTTLVVALVLLVVLALAVLAAVAGPATPPGGGAPPVDPGAGGVLVGAGILFFAFAGYARVATLAEEVVEPRRTLPRAVTVALAVVLTAYAVLALSLERLLGARALAASARPVVDAVATAGVPAAPVAVVAALAAGASCLGILLGLSRTALAMARDGVLPRALAVLDRSGEPRRAQVAVGAASLVGILLVDLPTALAASSVAVLVYYAIGHAAALTLDGRRGGRVLPVLGLAGCVAIAVALVLRLAGVVTGAGA